MFSQLADGRRRRNVVFAILAILAIIASVGAFGCSKKAATSKASATSHPNAGVTPAPQPATALPPGANAGVRVDAGPSSAPASASVDGAAAYVRSGAVEGGRLPSLKIDPLLTFPADGVADLGAQPIAGAAFTIAASADGAPLAAADLRAPVDVSLELPEGVSPDTPLVILVRESPDAPMRVVRPEGLRITPETGDAPAAVSFAIARGAQVALAMFDQRSLPADAVYVKPPVAFAAIELAAIQSASVSLAWPLAEVDQVRVALDPGAPASLPSACAAFDAATTLRDFPVQALGGAFDGLTPDGEYTVRVCTIDQSVPSPRVSPQVTYRVRTPASDALPAEGDDARLAVLIVDPNGPCENFVYRDSTGVRKSGKRKCPETIAPVTNVSADSVAVCATSGATDCVARDQYVAVEASALKAENLRAGVVLGGVEGAFPSAAFPLAGASEVADLTSFAATEPEYEWWDASGTRYQRSTVAGASLVPGTTEQSFPAGLYRDFSLAGSSELVPGNLRKGVEVFGVTGDFPSAAHPLAGASEPDLDIATFEARIKSGASFGWFDATGARLSRAGDADLAPGNILVGVSIFGTEGEVVGSVPPGLSLPMHFQFACASTALAGYTVLQSGAELYTEAKRYGWDAFVLCTERATAAPTLLKALHFSDNAIFRVDLPDGDYFGNVTSYDTDVAHDSMSLIVGGRGIFGNGDTIGVLARSFPFKVTGGQAQFHIDGNAGVDSNFVLNSLDIYRTRARLSLSAPSMPLAPDGTTIDTITGSGAEPNALVTLRADAGTVVAASDASAGAQGYQGVQALADAEGEFSFDVLRPGVAAAGGPSHLVATTVRGDAFGVVAVQYGAPGTPLSVPQHFQFTCSSPVESGYTSVSTASTYSPGTGYGWSAATQCADRGDPAGRALLRAFHYNSAFQKHTFKVDLADGDYVANFTMGRTDQNQGPVAIRVPPHEIADASIFCPAGKFRHQSLSITVENGQLQLVFDAGIGANDGYFIVNAVDVYATQSPITLSAPAGYLIADGNTSDNVSGTGAPANAIVTLTASAGTVTTADGDVDYFGTQVVANVVGAFSFTLKRPAQAGPVTVRAETVDGQALGVRVIEYQ